MLASSGFLENSGWFWLTSKATCGNIYLPSLKSTEAFFGNWLWLPKMSDGSTAAQYLGNLLYERSHFFISCKRDLFLGNYTTVCPSICMFVQSWLKCLKKYLMYLAKRLKTNDFGNCFFCCWFFLFRNDCYNIGWWLDEQIDWLLYIAIYCYIYIATQRALYNMSHSPTYPQKRFLSRIHMDSHSDYAPRGTQGSVSCPRILWNADWRSQESKQQYSK